VLDDSKLRKRFKGALARAGLKRLRLHDLRHTFGTLAVQAFPLSDVRAYMGHADIQTTMIYVHHVPQHDAAARLGRVVEGADGLAALGRVANRATSERTEPHPLGFVARIRTHSPRTPRTSNP